MSRGAIYSLALGAIVLLAVQRKYLRQVFIPLAVSSAGLVIAIVFQGLMAQINPTVSINFTQAISTSISQLTLGKINLFSPAEPAQNQTDTAPIFTEYIERSTGDRIDNTCRAAGIWLGQPSRAIFGVGLGGTGYYFEKESTRTAPWCKTIL